MDRQEYLNLYHDKENEKRLTEDRERRRDLNRELIYARVEAPAGRMRRRTSRVLTGFSLQRAWEIASFFLRNFKDGFKQTSAFAAVAIPVTATQEIPVPLFHPISKEAITLDKVQVSPNVEQRINEDTGKLRDLRDRRDALKNVNHTSYQQCCDDYDGMMAQLQAIELDDAGHDGQYVFCIHRIEHLEKELNQLQAERNRAVTVQVYRPLIHGSASRGVTVKIADTTNVNNTDGKTITTSMQAEVAKAQPVPRP